MGKFKFIYLLGKNHFFALVGINVDIDALFGLTPTLIYIQESVVLEIDIPECVNLEKT